MWFPPFFSCSLFICSSDSSYSAIDFFCCLFYFSYSIVPLFLFCSFIRSLLNISCIFLIFASSPPPPPEILHLLHSLYSVFFLRWIAYLDFTSLLFWGFVMFFIGSIFLYLILSIFFDYSFCFTGYKVVVSFPFFSAFLLDEAVWQACAGFLCRKFIPALTGMELGLVLLMDSTVLRKT